MRVTGDPSTVTTVGIHAPETATTRPPGSAVSADPIALSGKPTVMGRIAVLEVTPCVDGGRWPAKAVVGEAVPVRATVFREGHDAVAATVVLRRPDGSVHSRRLMTEISPGSDRYGVVVVPDAMGLWSFTVEGWSDPFESWHHAAEIKVAAGVDVELMLAEGAAVLERTLVGLPPVDSDAGGARRVLTDALRALRDIATDPARRLAVASGPDVRAVVEQFGLRDHVSVSPALSLTVERERALFSAWYEFFPRSEGARRDPETGRWTSGTFATAARRLPAVADMGFDIVYLPPIHPIGRLNRKGPNNTLVAGEFDPGSPWAIGSAEGGHDAIHPDLGDADDFAAFVATARSLGLETAIDLALQCAPDHPWATTHPEWFTTRADGSIAYAENPPKKYQDIYPLNFDNDPVGLCAEIRRIVELWISRGVTVFRVDNPHTKPVQFWEWLIGTINAEHPDIIFLAEAFTRPAMMATLGRVGFQQSYTYFTWRTTKAELTGYAEYLAGDSADYMRPNFWPNTPDILHAFLQSGGPAAFRLRAALAATMVPSWGMYSGYELYEHVPRPGAEEYIDNEKYEYRPRDWAAAERDGRSLAPYITRLNAMRREHPALQRLRNITFHPTTDDSVIAFSRHLPADQSPTGRPDTVLVVANLDPHGARESIVDIDPATIGAGPTFDVRDMVTDRQWTWGVRNYVRLDPYVEPVHIFHVHH